MSLSRLPRPIIGVLAGASVAALAVAVGIVRALVAVARGNSVDFTRDLAGLGAYVASFIVAGALVGTLWPVRRNVVGRVAIWILGMAVVVGTIMRMESGPFSAWTVSDIWLGVILTVMFGVAAAAGFERS